MMPYVLLACALAAMLTCTVHATAPVKVLLPLIPGATSHQFQLLRLHEELVARGHEVMVRPPLSLLRWHTAHVLFPVNIRWRLQARLHEHTLPCPHLCAATI